MPAFEPVYSERFLHSEEFGVWVEYVVPAGRRAIIKSMLISSTATEAGIAMVAINRTVIWRRHLPDANDSEAVECHQVAYQGEAIGTYANVAGIRTVVSGFLLSQPAAKLDELQDAQLATPGSDDPELEAGVR